MQMSRHSLFQVRNGVLLYADGREDASGEIKLTFAKVWFSLVMNIPLTIMYARTQQNAYSEARIELTFV